MSRLEKAFQEKKVFIAYLTVGAPSLEVTEKAALALEKGGVDILELGIPFSDPIADGPIIQSASTQALKNKTTPQDVLKVVQAIRKKSDIPLVLMSYYNPLLKGGKAYLEKAKKAGVDGFIVVDLPLEEADFYLKCMRSLKLDTIFLITPNTNPLRLEQIAKHSTGFIYYACQKGTTGLRDKLPKDVTQKIEEIKSITEKPVAVGFGIKDQKDAKEVLKKADAFIVGSAFMKHLQEKKSLKALTDLAKKMKP